MGWTLILGVGGEYLLWGWALMCVCGGGGGIAVVRLGGVFVGE